jgi:hypothetical protein
LIVCVVFASAHLNALERMEFLVLDIIYVIAILAVAAAVLLVADASQGTATTSAARERDRTCQRSGPEENPTRSVARAMVTKSLANSSKTRRGVVTKDPVISSPSPRNRDT